jgi:hypothetical protein
MTELTEVQEKTLAFIFLFLIADPKHTRGFNYPYVSEKLNIPKEVLKDEIRASNCFITLFGGFTISDDGMWRARDVVMERLFPGTIKK